MTRKRKGTRTSPANLRRSSSREQRETLRKKRQRRQRLRMLAWSAVVVLFLGVIAFLINRSAVNKPGESVANLGNTHISSAEADAVSYNSIPPTSGPHFGQLARWGVHDTPIPDGTQIHNLEDGGVGIWYDCPEGCPELITQLESVATNLGDEGLLLAPYPGLDSRIVLTAWNRIDGFETFDEARIRRFVSAYRGIDRHVRR